MKKLILILSILLGCYAANAQTTTDTAKHAHKGYNEGDYTDPQSHGDNFGNYGNNQTTAPTDTTKKGAKHTQAKAGTTTKTTTTTTTHTGNAPAKKVGPNNGTTKNPATVPDSTKSRKPKD